MVLKFQAAGYVNAFCDGVCYGSKNLNCKLALCFAEMIKHIHIDWKMASDL